MVVELHLFLKDEPQETSVRHCGICEIPLFYLALEDFWKPRPYESLEQAVRYFNDFQNDDAPHWLKIAVNLSVDNSLMEAGDCPVVADALRKTYEYAHPDAGNGGRCCPGLLDLAELLEDEKHIGLVTNTFNPQLGMYKSITLEDARMNFQRAVCIPSTTTQEQLYLMRHDVVGNMLNYRNRVERVNNL